jgi:hypothetical protein
MPLKTYRELLVWQKAMSLVEGIYRMTAQFPSTEQYGLACQLKRAAVSIPSNIAEGYGRTPIGVTTSIICPSRKGLFSRSKRSWCLPSACNSLPERTCSRPGRSLRRLGKCSRS